MVGPNRNSRDPLKGVAMVKVETNTNGFPLFDSGGNYLFEIGRDDAKRAVLGNLAYFHKVNKRTFLVLRAGVCIQDLSGKQLTLSDLLGQRYYRRIRLTGATGKPNGFATMGFELKPISHKDAHVFGAVGVSPAQRKREREQELARVAAAYPAEMYSPVLGEGLSIAAR